MRVYDFSELKQIAFELRNGKAAIVETDTVLGIICFDQQLIYKIKKRSHSKKIVLFVNRIEQIPFLSDQEKRVLEKFWPGPLTIIKNKTSYRIPNHSKLLLLLDMIGPIFCSSANISGRQTINNSEEARGEFTRYSDEIIAVKGKSLTTTPSTVYDFDERKLIRKGTISEEEIKSILGK